MTQRNEGQLSNFDPTLTFGTEDQRNKGKQFTGWLHDSGKVIEGKGIVYKFLIESTDLTEADIQVQEGTEKVRKPWPIIADGSQVYSVWVGRQAHGMLQAYINKGYGVGEWFRVVYEGKIPTPSGQYKGRPMHSYTIKHDMDKMMGMLSAPAPVKALGHDAAPAEVEEPLPAFDPEA